MEEGRLEFIAARRPELWLRNGEHLMLTAVSTSLAIAIGIPLGIVARRRPGCAPRSSELKAMEGIASDVREFPPGTWCHSGLGFHRVPESAPEEWPLAGHLRSLRLTPERAVVKRLMNGVPVGAFL